MNRDQVRARQVQWDRFHQWELRQKPRRVDLAKTWAWYEEVWTAAQQFRTDEERVEADQEKLGYIRLVRDRLACLPWPR